MDARWTIRINNVVNKTDAVIAAAVQAVDITPITQNRSADFTICTDVTSIASPKVIERVITAELSADFESKFPTEGDRYSSLYSMFDDRFGKMLPAFQVGENLELGDFCP